MYPAPLGPVLTLSGVRPEYGRCTGVRQAFIFTLNPQPSTHNPQPSTLNPQPSTLDPEQSLLPLGDCAGAAEALRAAVLAW